MTTSILIFVATVIAALLVRYARHDHFAGPTNRADDHDELGPVEIRQHLVPRHG